MEIRPAQRSDWKCEPLPTANKQLAFDRTYSNEEFQRIALGIIPESMEDKWFVYYEAPWLYLYRSWTGYCIYQIRFEPLDDRVKVAEVLVSRDPHQYSPIDDEVRDMDLLETLMHSIVTRDVRRRQMLDAFRFIR
jgi:hypothetical protein